MSGSWYDGSLGPDLSGENVANRIEHRGVTARDDQAVETGTGEFLDRNLGGIGVAAAPEEASRCVEFLGKGIGQLCLNPHQPEESSEELARIGRIICEIRGCLIRRATDILVMKSDRVRHRLDEGEGLDGVWASCRGQQRADAAIRMSDEVCTVAQRLGDVARVDLEVLSVRRWTLAKPASIQNEQCPAIGKRVLGLPCRYPARDAPVYEQDPRPLTAALDV